MAPLSGFTSVVYVDAAGPNTVIQQIYSMGVDTDLGGAATSFVKDLESRANIREPRGAFSTGVGGRTPDLAQQRAVTYELVQTHREALAPLVAVPALPRISEAIMPETPTLHVVSVDVCVICFESSDRRERAQLKFGKCRDSPGSVGNSRPAARIV